MGSPAYEDRTWTSPDGLALHYRDYAGPPDKPPILCIPGLTRNARDFEPVTEAFARKWRIICAELRGRGESEYAKDPSTYALPNYVADIEALLKQAGIASFVAFGTSLGGIIVLLLALRNPERIAAAMLNDIGTNVEAAGLERIREYVGQGRNFPTWLHAARWRVGRCFCCAASCPTFSRKKPHAKWPVRCPQPNSSQCREWAMHRHSTSRNHWKR